MSRAAAADDARQTAALHVRVRHLAGVRVVKVGGELDLAGAPLLADALERPGLDTVVDCRSCTFADSTGLATLLAGHRSCFDAGLGYAVVAGHGSLLGRMLEMTGLVHVLAMYDSLDEAVGALTGA
jgi:anti-anti-sigma factor